MNDGASIVEVSMGFRRAIAPTFTVPTDVGATAKARPPAL